MVTLWCGECLVAAIRRKALRYHAAGTLFGPDVVNHTGVTIGHFGARPIPVFETTVYRLIAFVRVKVGMALPLQSGAAHLNFNA